MDKSTRNLDASELINSVFAPTTIADDIHIGQPHNQKILHNGFTFTFDKQSSDGSKNFWRCSKKHGCTARLHTDATRDDLVIKEMNEHSHEKKRTRVNERQTVLNGKFTKDNGFEELQNHPNGLSYALAGCGIIGKSVFEINQSSDSLSLDTSALISSLQKFNDSPSMPKLEPQRKWTSARKTRIFADFKAGLLRKEPFETDFYFSRLVNADGQRIAVICNYCCNIYSPQTGGQQAYHKRVCSHIQKVENGDQLDLADYDTSTQSPLSSNVFGRDQEMVQHLSDVKHSMSFLHAMIDTADGAEPAIEIRDTCSANDRFNADKERPSAPKRAKLTSTTTDMMSSPKASSTLEPVSKMVISLKDVEGMPMVAKITPKQLTFSDFRRIFLIPKNHPHKRFMFKCECEDGSAEFQWLLAMEDDMELPVSNNQIVAEARTYLD